jgi:hypothetical protein
MGSMNPRGAVGKARPRQGTEQENGQAVADTLVSRLLG